MKVQSINFTNKLAFGEVNQYGHRANAGSLNNPNETVNLGNPFKEDVFEYARKKAKLPKDFDLHFVINQDDLYKLTNILDTAARKKELIKMLIKKGLLKK